MNINDATLDAIHEGLADLDDRHDYLENQNRRNNIKLFGIPEEKQENWDDCERKAKEAIAGNLGIKDEMIIERAHRVGRPGNTRVRGGRGMNGSNQRNDEPRPIVVKFNNWKQKSKVIKAAQKIRPKGISFREDFSKRVLDRRAELVPQLISARQEGKNAFLVMDKLVIMKDKPPDVRRRSYPNTVEETEVTNSVESASNNESDNEVSINTNK